MASTKDKKVVIVESPAKAKTIGRFLGSDYTVEASFGHVRDLPQNAAEIPANVKQEKWARLGVNIDKNFEPLYVVPKDKKDKVAKLRQAVKGASEILLATDEDREGESISWHVLQLVSPGKTTKVSRIVFHEVTKEAIQEALSRPRDLNESLVRAQEARRVLDRLYGYTLSPLLWKKIVPGLSAGRVQSVAVRLAVMRERQRKAFVAATYWDIEAELRAKEGVFKATLVRVSDRTLATGKSFDPNTGEMKDSKALLLDQNGAESLARALNEARPWEVTRLDEKQGEQKPYPPFTTSTLQQEGNRKLRFSAKRTMQIAQQLYEGIDLEGERVGLITYMRTDSLTLAERALQEARQVIKDAYGADYLPQQPIRYKTKAKGAQEAHEAIRPTDISRKPEDVRRFLDDDQYKLYELIWKRTVACQMVPARVLRKSVEVTVRHEQKDLVFYASGKRIVFPGYLRAYVEGSDDPDADLEDKEVLLPAIEKGEHVEPVSLKPEGHTTKPPARYTEASLVKKLEEEGVGRPSTYATVITTIQDRGYIVKRSNELIPTFTAFGVIELLEKHFEDLVDLEFTARMEEELDEVARGEIPWVTPLNEFYHGVDDHPGLAARVKTEESRLAFPQIAVGDDPESGQAVIVKIGRYGPYVQRGEGGQGNYASVPEDIAPADLDVATALSLLNQKGAEPTVLCDDPETGRPVKALTGRYGDYLEVEADGDGKPKRVSLPKGVSLSEVTPEMAQRLLSLPRALGKHPESGEDVSTGLGPYGPYLKHGSDYRRLPDWETATDISFEEGLALLEQPKEARGKSAGKSVIKEFGELEGAAGPVKVLSGRFGPYVTDGRTNATLPKNMVPEEITEEEAMDLLRKKAAAGPTKKRKTTRRAS